jgi:hypothetical protein
MRRSTMAATITVVVMTLVTAAIASPTAASAAASSRVRAGSQWTLELTGTGCQTDSFAAHHTFGSLGGADGDQGTYKGTKTLTMTWTAGTASGEVFKGRWRRSAGDYTGTDDNDRVSVAATLVPLATGGCATVAPVPGS